MKYLAQSRKSVTSYDDDDDDDDKGGEGRKKDNFALLVLLLETGIVKICIFCLWS